MRVLFLTLISWIVAAAPLAAAVQRFEHAGSVVELDAEAGTLKRIAIAGTTAVIRGEETPLWRLYWYDAETAKLNEAPLHGSEAHYWQTPFQTGKKYADSRQAELTGQHFDPRTGELVLDYRRNDAELRFKIRLLAGSVCWSVEGRNLAEEPVYLCNSAPDWILDANEKAGFIVPDFTAAGLEYSPVNQTSFAMCDAWNGFLARTTQGISAVHFIQPQTVPFLATRTDLTGRGESACRFSPETILWRKKGESFQTPELRFCGAKDLRAWADLYIADNFTPAGKLANRLPPEIFDRMGRSYLAPVSGKINDVTEMLPALPGHALIHPPHWMHDVQGRTNDFFDAFPNYFPPHPSVGTMEDLKRFGRAVRDAGHLLMPRNSYFYWTTGSDVDLNGELAGMAMVRVDGKPRTAQWVLPGYLISPSSRQVQEKLKMFADRWREEIGAQVRFSNVIGAIGPYGNRYDFHPDAPGPDLYYDQILQMMRRHGGAVPLLSEGGGAWLQEAQAGFCRQINWDPEEPAAPWRMDPARGKFVAAVNEIGPMITHEYAEFYPHNAGSGDASSGIARIAFSLVNGYNLKAGINRKDAWVERNLRYLHAIALLADTVWGPMYGRRLESYSHDGEHVVHARYGTVNCTANFSRNELKLRNSGMEFQIPEGGFFAADDARSFLAGYFKTGTMRQPELIVIRYRSDGGTEIFAPLAEHAFTAELPLAGGIRELRIPAFQPELVSRTPGIAVDSSGTMTVTGKEAGEKEEVGTVSIPTPSDCPNAPLLIDWQAGRDELPPRTECFGTTLTPAEIRLARRDGKIIFENPLAAFDRTVYLEVIFRYDEEPAFCNGLGENQILHPLGVDGRTIELRYNQFLDSIRFLIRLADGTLADLTNPNVPLRRGKYYHLIAWYDGKTQFLSVNDDVVSAPRSGHLHPATMRWQAGDRMGLAFRAIRIGGTGTVVPPEPGTLALNWNPVADEFCPTTVSSGAVMFTPDPAREHWCYLMSGLESHRADLQDFRELEFLLDLEIPPGMYPLIALQPEQGANFFARELKPQRRPDGRTVLRVSRKDFLRDGESLSDARGVLINYIYCGIVGKASRPVPGKIKIHQMKVISENEP